MADACPWTDEGQQDRAADKTNDPAQHVEAERKTCRHLEMLRVAMRDAVAAVANDQLPRLEFRNPVHRTHVAGDEDEHTEEDNAKAACGKGERCNAADRRHNLRDAEIAR